MITSHKLKFICIVLLVCFSVLACNKTESQSHAQNLSDENIDAFLQTMAKDYLELATSLYKAAHQYEKTNDVDGFISYRNETWTELYIENKRRYEATYELNKSYLLETKQTKPFQLFSGLIYTGLNYKHSLQNNDRNLMLATDKEISKNSHYMKQLLATN